MKSQNLDIKSLTAELKHFSKGNNEKKEAVKNASTKEPTSQAINHVKTTLSDDKNEVKGASKLATEFLAKVKKINSKDHYNIDKFIYVDGEIHEVFSKLKLHTKLKLSYLASHLLETFFMENKEAIREILNQKQNKFLD